MILAIDTATRWLGMALHDGTAVLAEMGWRCLNNHTIELTPNLQVMMQRANVTPADLDGIAVAIGPGSYTGLRVGMALAKGLALANQTPLLGISTLDIVAAAFGPFPGQLWVVAEAGRTRICTAPYEWENGRGWQTSETPIIESWESLLPKLEGRVSFAGEITAQATRQIKAADRTFQVMPPATAVRRAGYLAELGWRRLRAGNVDDAQTLAPIYLRDPAGN
ncbi:MAG: tRNA (adenosine(37)-N6)-threonylcarbamoyltransferase complex dimerization subunit type 1 TsaB [Ardenticatenaceae bacterium]|nr:tRNA (adenosine(37)-N6)-threonylcarbamoyltransferase complex dimerization subunit type 1 TsaB [Anaerolineales bacterium]MCB8941350.1 tRNA (adenosine(37)-N6)-threonylcarbamoyltransferase complex dimerization subunit type 1 TsaB [Ardenticatenaceae bacterium]MCB8972706.1 tRNA (adenosine(37)-N6)-threonylcarbamoyltransferase complex dimerization subunit type 1 TsaB [Ardenticatenaceae bacterium]